MELTNPLTEDHVFMSSTFNGHPLGAAAGNAVLDILEHNSTYQELYDYSNELRTLIDDILADSGINGRAIGEGPIVDYVLTESTEVTDWRTIVGSDTVTKKRIDEALIDEGILQNVGGKRYISTEHGSEELELTSEAFKNAVERVDT
jgi:glutamate-1-semialdehyde aminotransferase